MNSLVSQRADSVGTAVGGAIRISDAAAPPESKAIGIRPEELRAPPWANDEGVRRATAYELEPLGGYTVITLDAGETRLRALMRGQPEIRQDSQVALSFDDERVHDFAQDGARLAHTSNQ